MGYFTEASPQVYLQTELAIYIMIPTIEPRGIRFMYYTHEKSKRHVDIHIFTRALTPHSCAKKSLVNHYRIC